MSPLVRYLYRNLLSRPFVSFLVVLCMVVVSATIGGVAAVGSGLRDAFTTKGHGNWVMVTSRNVVSEAESKIDVSLLGALTVSPDVRRHSTEALVTNLVDISGSATVIQLRGLEPGGFEMHGMTLLEGHMPIAGAAELLAGDALRVQVPSLRIGSTVRLMDVDVTCVGFFHAEGYYSGEAWTTRAFFLANPERRNLAVVYLETDSVEKANELSARISNDRALQLAAVPAPQFHARTLKEFNHLFAGLVIVFVLVGSGAVLASASLIALVQQRRLSELCVMRAMGFRTLRIAVLIIVETEVCVLGGGLLGILITTLALRDYAMLAISLDLTEVIFRSPVTLALGLLTLGVMVLIGLMGASVPVARMINTSITRGLRDD